MLIVGGHNFESKGAMILSMTNTMRLVALICNFWTLILSFQVMWNLGKEVYYAKKNVDRKKI